MVVCRFVIHIGIAPAEGLVLKVRGFDLHGVCGFGPAALAVLPQEPGAVALIEIDLIVPHDELRFLLRGLDAQGEVVFVNVIFERSISGIISSPELPRLIRRLYLEIVKPSMSYKLYYLVSESILKTLKDELSVKLLLDAIDSPWLVLTSQFGTIEESCARVLECVDTLAKRQVKTHNIGNLAARQALQYIDENYARSITVSEISRCFNVSPSYLSQCFKQEVGVSIKHYLIMRRMQQAKHLLLTTDKPIGAVALAVGYDDYRQFSKMFKSLTGVTPVQCRKGVMAQLAEEIPEAHFSLEI